MTEPPDRREETGDDPRNDGAGFLENGKMVAFERNCILGNYVCSTKLLPLESVANFERKVPREWINAAGNGVEKAFIDYALPLIQGETGMKVENALPRFARLKKVLARPTC